MSGTNTLLLRLRCLREDRIRRMQRNVEEGTGQDGKTFVLDGKVKKG